MIDKRFALIRQTDSGTEVWHAALVESKTSGIETFRLSWPGRTKDRFGAAEEPVDIAEVAAHVICNGARIRWVSETSGQSNSLGLRSARVVGYRLDVTVASRCGVSATTA